MCFGKKLGLLLWTIYCSCPAWKEFLTSSTFLGKHIIMAKLPLVLVQMTSPFKVDSMGQPVYEAQEVNIDPQMVVFKGWCIHLLALIAESNEP